MLNSKMQHGREFYILYILNKTRQQKRDNVILLIFVCNFFLFVCLMLYRFIFSLSIAENVFRICNEHNLPILA